MENGSAGFRRIGRREFLKASGTLYVVAAAGCSPERPRNPPVPPTEAIDASRLPFPPSAAYLLVDTRKCQGCLSCMLACSLAHEGQENLSLARLQVMQDPFGCFPSDLALETCRQCLDPQCVRACPVDALQVDRKTGNVRRVRADLCQGCMQCVEACPHPPSRAIWNFEAGKAVKCDLCAEAPFWKETGGPAGKQACVEVCPVGAILLAREIPLQEGERGYKVNLRGETWARLGYDVGE